jgi:hypothetical protein
MASPEYAADQPAKGAEDIEREEQMMQEVEKGIEKAKALAREKQQGEEARAAQRKTELIHDVDEGIEKAKAAARARSCAAEVDEGIAKAKAAAAAQRAKDDAELDKAVGAYYHSLILLSVNGNGTA